jgi:4-oxalocrotonate tautomerase
MPFVTVKILEGHSVERKRRMVKEISKSLAKIAEIPESYVQVVIEDVPRDNWGSYRGLMSDPDPYVE